MAGFEIKERQAGDVTILDVEGEIVIGEGHVALRAAVRRLVEAGRSKLVLNFARAGHVDEIGLGEIASSGLRVERAGGRLRLLNLTRSLHDMLSAHQLLPHFDVHTDEAAAVDSFGRD